MPSNVLWLCNAAWQSATRASMKRSASKFASESILGEVIVEGEDRYGEGVNVASRLQQLADPGGICVSGKVSKEVERKLAFGFEPMVEQRMKNITEPIACYRVSLHLQPTQTPFSSKDRR